MPEDQLIMVLANPLDETTDQGMFKDFAPGTRTLQAGFRVDPAFMPLPCDIVFDKDVAVTLRDGTVIYVDIYRPAGAERVPVLLGWSPYGKSRGNGMLYRQLFGLLGMATGELSGLMRFEGADPAFWCANGYAICSPDPRGCFHSEGDIKVWSREEGEDYADLIEFLGVQDWCNGKVGTTGNSYLAISQWFLAGQQPPHLAAIAPWEGMSDIYRDLIKRGGIPDYPFPRTLERSFVGKNNREDMVAECEAHPLLDAFWERKIPAFDKVTVPAYVVASYSNSIHTPGTFRGWRRIASQDKWLRIHNNMEWPDYYEPENLADLLRFFDRYLKGADNGWETTPRVRYALMDLAGGDRVNLPADSFPPRDVVPTRYYLDTTRQVLDTAVPESANASYDAQSAGQLSFLLRIDAPTDFIGYPKARLWLEADGADDMDVFLFLEKLNQAGERLEQFNIPNHGPQMQALTKDGAAILKYKGSNGRLRVSMRHLDPVNSTDEIPAHSFDRVEKLAPGQVVCVDIDLFPIGLALRPGEQLRLTISGTHLFGGVMPGTANVQGDNHGRHILHSGGERASYLQLHQKPGAG